MEVQRVQYEINKTYLLIHGLYEVKQTYVI